MRTIAKTTMDPNLKSATLPFIGRCLKSMGMNATREGDSYYVDLGFESNLVIGFRRNRISVAVVMPAGYNMNYDDFEPGMKMCRYIGEELPNLLRNIFPLSDRREDNFIGGLSMGSNGAQKIAIRYPDNYAAVLAMSAGSFNVRPKDAPRVRVNTGMPMPPHKPDEMEENCEILKRAAAEGKKLPKFFMIWGEKDIAREGAIRSAEFLRAQGCDVYAEEVPGVGHWWDLWDPALKKALEELLPMRHDLI